MKILATLRREMRTGDCIPPWYYGYCYTVDFAHYYVFYPMPLHWFVRFWHMLKLAWIQVQAHGIEDDRIHAKRLQCQNYRDGYDVGFKAGRRQAFEEWRGGSR